MHTTPNIPQLFISFGFFLILLFQMKVHMRRLEDNGQPLQGGNELMIKMVKRGNRRINVKQKSHKMKCLTQIQSNKLVSIKLSFLCPFKVC